VRRWYLGTDRAPLWGHSDLSNVPDGNKQTATKKAFAPPPPTILKYATTHQEGSPWQRGESENYPACKSTLTPNFPFASIYKGSASLVSASSTC